MKTTLIKAALTLAFGAVAVSAQAATLGTGNTLNITDGVYATNASGSGTNVSSGSWFAMDLDGDSKIQAGEKTTIIAGTAGGMVIGATSAIGAQDNWFFNKANGYNYFPTISPTQNGNGSLNLAGWVVNWNGGDIPMPSGAWNVLNCATVGVACANTSGEGVFTYAVSGGAYTLDYAATVPSGGFAGTQYYAHLVGTVTVAPVSQVPVPAAAWLLGSGLLGLVGVARRRKAA